MARIIFFCAVSLFFSNTTAAQQNVGIGSSSPEAKLHIIGSENISQLIIQSNGPQSNTNPLLKLRRFDSDILWLHADNSSNIFIGVNAGRVNNTSLDAYNNTFIGSDAGFSNTEGSRNTCVGSGSLRSNVFGSYNTAIGIDVLRSAPGSIHNTGVGAQALMSITTGNNNAAVGGQALTRATSGGANVAMGYRALYSNTTAEFNTAFGHLALYENVSGSNNTGVGAFALRITTASEFNTAIGYQSGDSYDNGYNNVFVGANTDVNGTGYFNVIAMGQGTTVGGSSVARFGNPATVSYGGWAGWTNVSDGRFKKDVQENVPGLAFISRLKPVTYHLSATALNDFLHKKNPGELTGPAKAMYTKALLEKEAITYTGFIAQEVASAATAVGFDFSGIEKPVNENDNYGLRYAEFVVPLVKAVQEQQQMISDLLQQNKKLKDDMQELKLLVQRLQ